MFWKTYIVVFSFIVLFFLASYFRFEKLGDEIYRCRWTNTIYVVDGGFITLEQSVNEVRKRLNKEAPE